METTPKSRRDRRRRRRLLAFLMSAMAIGTATTTAFSLALFTASTTVAQSGFTTGRIGITTDHATTALFTPSGNLMPGDPALTQPLLVSNTGNADLRYAMTTNMTGSTALGSELQLEIRDADAGGGCTAFSGTQLYTGAIAAAAIGDPAPGRQSNEQTIVGGGAQTLCFRVWLPKAATTQDATVTVGFTFDAEQTANN